MAFRYYQNVSQDWDVSHFCDIKYIYIIPNQSREHQNSANDQIENFITK